MTGERSRKAPPTPVARLVAPGPSVARQKPGAPVIRPVTSAAKPAEPSCAVSTNSIPPVRIASMSGSTLPLGMPNPRATPFALSVAMIRSALFMVDRECRIACAVHSRRRLEHLRSEPLAKIGLAEIPEQSRHHTEPLARDRREQVLVGRVLRASGIRVRDPDRAQTEHVGEAVVRQRSAETGQNGRRAPGGVLDRMSDEADPRIVWIEPARLKKSASAAAHLDLREAVAVEMAAQRRNDVVYAGPDDITQLAVGARLARNGVNRMLRRSRDKGQHLEAVPGEDALGRAEIRFAPVAVDGRTVAAAVDLHIGKKAPHGSGQRGPPFRHTNGPARI